MGKDGYWHFIITSYEQQKQSVWRESERTDAFFLIVSFKVAPSRGGFLSFISFSQMHKSQRQHCYAKWKRGNRQWCDSAGRVAMDDAAAPL